MMAPLARRTVARELVRVAGALIACLMLLGAARSVGAQPAPVAAEARPAAGRQPHRDVPRPPPSTAALLDVWLKGTGIAASDVGLVAVPVEGGPALLGHDSVQPFNPASTMKILTSAAALSILGPEHRWRTAAYLRGRLEDGVLTGDLVLRGGGDPKLVVEDLAAFVGEMRRAGLREIRGDLVIDDALFDVGRDSVERFDLDLSQPYNVRPHALLMNFKATRVIARPGPGGVEIALDPPLAGVQIDNAVRVVRGPCRHGAAGLVVRDETIFGRPPGIRVSGSYSPSCGEQSSFVSVLSHRDFVGALFGAVWQAAGGAWSGRARVEPGAGRGTPWREWVSPRTLSDVVRDINKYSNNVMARQVFLALAAATGDSPATVERSREVLADWLRAQQLELPGLFVENGSGLSRSERVGAAGLARVLQHAAAGPHAALLRESLPVVGVDGTMKRRLADEPVAGRAWIKTGSLADVRSIAGYVDAASGRRYAVVFIVNGPRAVAAAAAQDRFLKWVHANG
ncbi:MAG TPA: D-alanyl-D-alanine carboxypeptidase/D-alanyl-D-alanine-endopeptidase [Quisquiliibacterium sp.]|nr:D-alanyl-D-alanine carboxypeptidase/D-alanyl-D-alanine-endopeptidase [Quisquiliibacterium sp.]